MGSGYVKKCPKCDFKFESITGVGFLFPMDYEDTVQEARDGKLGQEIQAFFKEHENGAINAENVTLCCAQCGHLSNDKDLTMYVPNDKYRGLIGHGNWTAVMPFEESEYVSSFDLEMYYEEYAKNSHKCKECGGPMHIITEEEDMLCPACKVPMKTTGSILWD